MTLVIEKSVDYNAAFMEWLLEHIKYLLLSHINPCKSLRVLQHIQKSNLFKLQPDELNALDVDEGLITGIKNLKYKEVRSHYIFYIDPNITVKNVDELKVCTLCKLVNYGDLGLRGYPIFSNTFSYVAANATKYYARYIKLLIGGI